MGLNHVTSHLILVHLSDITRIRLWLTKLICILETSQCHSTEFINRAQLHSLNTQYFFCWVDQAADLIQDGVRHSCTGEASLSGWIIPVATLNNMTEITTLKYKYVIIYIWTYISLNKVEVNIFSRHYKLNGIHVVMEISVMREKNYTYIIITFTQPANSFFESNPENRSKHVINIFFLWG